MSTKIQTERIDRSWTEKLMLWRAAYRTCIFDEHREAIGRGPTVEASRVATLRRWVEDHAARANKRPKFRSPRHMSPAAVMALACLRSRQFAGSLLAVGTE